MQILVYNHFGATSIISDKQIIKNIIINFISNAIKFTEDKKTITITTKNSETEFIIEVTDQGIGIPEEEQKNLFSRFFRARNATNIQGTGLGLSIVFKYIEVLNGKITFESELNKGTTFTVTLPNT